MWAHPKPKIMPNITGNIGCQLPPGSSTVGYGKQSIQFDEFTCQKISMPLHSKLLNHYMVTYGNCILLGKKIPMMSPFQASFCMVESQCDPVKHTLSLRQAEEKVKAWAVHPPSGRI